MGVLQTTINLPIQDEGCPNACPDRYRVEAYRISSRALFVNVRHRIDPGLYPLRINRPVRSVNVRVFPDPGPASVRILPWM